jgi:hypothetical protein
MSFYKIPRHAEKLINSNTRKLWSEKLFDLKNNDIEVFEEQIELLPIIVRQAQINLGMFGISEKAKNIFLDFGVPENKLFISPDDMANLLRKISMFNNILKIDTKKLKIKNEHLNDQKRQVEPALRKAISSEEIDDILQKSIYAIWCTEEESIQIASIRKNGLLSLSNFEEKTGIRIILK